jgi:hypothetical protein
MQMILSSSAGSWTSIFDDENWQALCENIASNPIFLWLILGGVIFFGMIFFVLRCCHKKRANRIRICTTNRGPIFLKQSALKHAVKKICHQIIPQSKTRVKVCSCFGKIRLKISVACPHHIQPVSFQLQEEIIRILRQEIGINNLGPVRVIVEKIIGPIQIPPTSIPIQQTADSKLAPAPSDCCSMKNVDFCGKNYEKINKTLDEEQQNNEQQNGKEI